MIKRKPTVWELNELREIAEFQFGIRGELLIPNNVDVVVSVNTNRIRFILLDNEKYLSLRSRDYRFNLHIASAHALNKLLPHPRLRVYVKEPYVEFVARGGSLFSKHVLMADPDIRPGDEVLVVDFKGSLIAVGRAKLSGWEITHYNRGEAVKVREGVIKQ